MKPPLQEPASRLVHRICIAATLIVATACNSDDQRRGCSSANKELPSIEMEATLPRRASAIVFASRLEQVFENADNLNALVPQSASGASSACDKFEELFALSFCGRGGWEKLGARFGEPAILILDEQEVSIRVSTTEPRAISTWAATLAQSNTALRHEPAAEGRAARLLRKTEGGEREVLSYAEFKNLAILSLEPDLGLGKKREVALSKHVFELTKLTPEERWGASSKNKALRQKLAPLGPVHGVIRPGRALAALPAANEDAARQRDRLAAQFGALGFATQFFKPEGHLRLHLMLQEDVEEATLLPKLEKVEGELPTNLGSLIEPGVLGVLRLSILPEEFFSMLRLGLPPAQRDELDALFETLETEFALDANEAVVKNLSGHMLVVFYGLEPQAFESDPVTFVRDLLMLQATREAIYLPIEDRQKMARFLDAMTQLTRNKLQRQNVGETLQYAWMEDGALSWAIVLHDDYMMLIDSTAAFDHAMRHVRNPKEIAPGLAKMGLSKLLADERQVGLYLDASSVLTVLPEESRQPRTWLAPIKSLMMHADVTDKTRTTRIELDLWLR